MCMNVIFDVFDVSLMYNCECNSVSMFVQDIHHISYIVNNVMLFLDFMELYLELNYFV